MTASTALLALSMEMEEKNKLLKARERMTLEDLENEFQQRKNKMNEISRIFASIRGMLTINENKETVLGSIYVDLKQSINEFEATLIAEVAATDNENNKPIETAEKLKHTVCETFDKSNTLEEKTRSVTEFRNYARNAKHSEATKCAIGATIGTLVAVASIAFMLTMIGIVGAPPVGIIILASVVSIFMLALGASAGINAALSESKNQNDARGRHVSKNLQTLVTERHRFFQTNINAPPEYSTDTKDRVMESTLRYSGSG